MHINVTTCANQAYNIFTRDQSAADATDCPQLLIWFSDSLILDSWFWLSAWQTRLFKPSIQYRAFGISNLSSITQEHTQRIIQGRSLILILLNIKVFVTPRISACSVLCLLDFGFDFEFEFFFFFHVLIYCCGIHFLSFSSPKVTLPFGYCYNSQNIVCIVSLTVGRT